MILDLVERVAGEVGDRIVIQWVALVPVLGDVFVAGRVLEVAGVALHGVEGFEGLTIEATFGILCRMVGHEAIDEAIRRRRRNDP